jgi:hypothetical protein
VYAAVGYYLRHREEVDHYLDEYEREAEALRVKVEPLKKSRNEPDIRARILARQQAQTAEASD